MLTVSQIIICIRDELFFFVNVFSLSRIFLYQIRFHLSFLNTVKPELYESKLYEILDYTNFLPGPGEIPSYSLKDWLVRKSELYECFRRSLAIRTTQVWLNLYGGFRPESPSETIGVCIDRYRWVWNILLFFLRMSNRVAYRLTDPPFAYLKSLWIKRQRISAWQSDDTNRHTYPWLLMNFQIVIWCFCF